MTTSSASSDVAPAGPVRAWPTPHLRDVQRLGYHVERHRMREATSLHRQPGIEVSVIVEGRAELSIAGGPLVLPAGRMAVFRGDQPHRFSPGDTPALRMALCLNETQLAPLTDPRGVPLFATSWVPSRGWLAVKLTSAWQEQLARWVDVLADEAVHDRPGGGAYRMGVLMQCWAGLHRFTAAQAGVVLAGGPSFSRVSEIVAEARQYVQRHLAGDLSLARVSEQVDTSEEYLTRAFRLELGVPFRQYVIRQRLAHARRLLVEGDLPVTQVSLSAGFGSLSHFCRTFKRVFGQTPTSCRSSAGRHL